MHIKDTLRKYGNEIFVSGVIVLAGLTGLGIHAYRQHQREVEKRDNPIVYQIKEDRWQIKILERRNEYLITGEQTQLPYPLNIPLIINKELTNELVIAPIKMIDRIGRTILGKPNLSSVTEAMLTIEEVYQNKQRIGKLKRQVSELESLAENQ